MCVNVSVYLWIPLHFDRRVLPSEDELIFIIYKFLEELPHCNSLMLKRQPVITLFLVAQGNAYDTMQNKIKQALTL